MYKVWLFDCLIVSGRTRWLYIMKLINPTITCKMDFGKLPFDRHTCHFIVYSNPGAILSNDMKGQDYGYIYQARKHTKLEYEIEFSDLPMSSINVVEQFPNMPEALKTPLKKIRLDIMNVAGFTMVLTRHWNRFIYIYYLPSSMFVLTSWASFLVSPKVTFLF